MEAASVAMTTGQPVVDNDSQRISLAPQDPSHIGETVRIGEDRAERGWKYAGYPAFARWMASSNDFFVLRRFDALNARVLLRLQDQIAELEDKLKAVDQTCMEAEVDTVHSRLDSLRLDRQIQPEREELLEELTGKLEQYNLYINTYSGIRGRGTASKQHLQNVENWTMNHPFAVDRREQHTLQSPSDTVALVDRSKSTLRLAIEKLIVRTSVGGTRYFDERMVDRLENAVIFSSGLVMLFAPLWALQTQMKTAIRLGIVTAFVCFFTLLLAIGAVAKPFEILTAATAYSVVLMIFLSQTVNVSTN